MTLTTSMVLVGSLLASGSVSAQDAPGRGTANGRIAFGMNVDDNVDVYSVLPDGTHLARLTEGPGFDACPAWAPDGASLVYCAGDMDGTFEIWEMAVDGSRPRQVTRLDGSALFPDVSPDGSLIVFEWAVGDAPPQIMVVPRAGGDAVTLTTEGANTHPVWSPDGTRIAFGSDRTGSGQVWVMAADGTDQRQLTTDGLAHGAPEWSPDGTRIAYDTFTGDVQQVWVMDADGTDPTPVTHDPAGNGGAAWSPDGQHIAFVSWRVDPPGILLMAADGTGQTVLVPGGRQLIPAWQPLRAGLTAELPMDADPLPTSLLGSWSEPVADGIQFRFLAADDPLCVRLVHGVRDCYAAGDPLADPGEYGLVGVRGDRFVVRTLADPLEWCVGAEAEFAWALAGDRLTLTSVTPECHGDTPGSSGGVTELVRG